jgi:hypothetical protein
MCFVGSIHPTTVITENAAHGVPEIRIAIEDPDGVRIAQIASSSRLSGAARADGADPWDVAPVHGRVYRGCDACVRRGIGSVLDRKSASPL